MTSQQYSVGQASIDSLFSWIKTGEIAIPEIQRPFVWDATKVRNFLDSLLKGYPVGFLISWKNPDVKLKDGTTSSGKRILIDGQQRITALMASILGREIVDKQYKRTRIRIAYHPGRDQFEVSNPAIQKDVSWIADISELFSPNISMFEFVERYCERNPAMTRDEVFRKLEGVKGITNNQIGLIELNSNLDIETVTEIFIRVNSEGVPLSQADFAMSKIAVNETYGGNTLRKAIDYFCHLSVAPDFYSTIMQNDQEFARTPFAEQLKWLRNENDDLYDPSYTDMLRVAFTSEFKRGRLEDLVALLSGRNFETRQFEDAIVEDSFARLKNGITRFMNETEFKRFIMIVRSAGFIDTSLIGSRNALNFAYILYLTLRGQGWPANDIELYTRRWFAMSLLTGRYSGSAETMIDFDIRQLHDRGVHNYLDDTFRSELSDSFWTVTLPLNLNTSVSSSPAFRMFVAAQVKLGDKGFLSRDISVRELVEYKSDVHHLFPRDLLKRHGMPRSQYNQIANYVVAQSEINIAISNKEPKRYFSEISDQVAGGVKRYGNIINPDDLAENYRMNCIPDGMSEMGIEDYPAFLAERRLLKASRIRTYFERL